VSRLTRRVALSLALTCAAVLAVAAQDIPYLTGRVVDDAGILSEGARARLTATLKAHEDATTNQIVVLTVPTIGSTSIEEYAVKVFGTWKLGQKGKDNGVLIVVVPQDRKMRIEVGYGLEPTLTDGFCGDVIRGWMTPSFKAGNYDKGIEDGVNVIIARLDGQPEPAGRPAPAVTHGGGSANDMDWKMRILIGIFVFSIIGLFTVIGVLTPGVGWFLYVFLIPFWAMFPMIIIGTTPTLALLGAYLIGYPAAKLSLRNKPWYVKAARDLKSRGSTTIGGFTISSGSGGGSSGGGGFSGGGGSSGGGGASGSW
jgi:uncharacterized protein